MNLSDKISKTVIIKVKEAADFLGLETYLIGGYVRDIFLNRPSKDIDFVCVGSGIALAKEVNKSFPNNKLSVFKSFGTAMLTTAEADLEFVGARKESYRSSSRKPIVEDGTLEDDQLRRDFTINALAISINEQTFGQLIDPFNGRLDLKKKSIRTPLDANITFSDDPLRMMRAIRFASQLEFDIEPNTFDAIGPNLDRIFIVSQERITDELNKIILSPKPSYGFKLLFISGLLAKIFPEMVELHGVDKKEGKSHKDNFYHTLQVLDNVAKVSDDLWLRWAAILHDIAKPATKRFNSKVGWTFHGHEDKGARMVPIIFKKLKLPLNDKMHFVKKLVRLHLRPIALVKEDITDSAIRRLLFESGNDLKALMMLCKADITSKNDQKVKKYLANFVRVEEKLKIVEENDHLSNFQPPISGELIMETFNLKPSRVVGLIKDEIKEAIIEGKISNNIKEAKSLMMELAVKHGLSNIPNSDK